jgi:hypothetical protein
MRVLDLVLVGKQVKMMHWRKWGGGATRIHHDIFLFPFIFSYNLFNKVNRNSFTWNAIKWIYCRSPFIEQKIVIDWDFGDLPSYVTLFVFFFRYNWKSCFKFPSLSTRENVYTLSFNEIEICSLYFSSTFLSIRNLICFTHFVLRVRDTVDVNEKKTLKS